MSHPSLGLPPSDPTAGWPAAATRIRADQAGLAARALRVAFDRDPKMEARQDEDSTRQLLHDTGLLAERVALALETGDETSTREYAEWTAPLYRRRRVPMDDLIGLCEGLRAALPTLLGPDEMAAAGASLDAAIKVYRWHRRLAGDARKRNAFLQFIYKGG